MDNAHAASVTNSHLETDAGGTKRTNVFLHQKRRHRLTGRYTRRVQVVERAILGREAEFRAEIPLKEIVRIRHAICGTLPCVSTTLNRDARVATNVDSDTLRLMRSPAKSSKKTGGKGSVVIFKESCCVSRFLSEKTCST